MNPITSTATDKQDQPSRPSQPGTWATICTGHIARAARAAPLALRQTTTAVVPRRKGSPMNGLEKEVSTTKPPSGKKGQMKARTRAAAMAVIALVITAIPLVSATAASAVSVPLFYTTNPGATCWAYSSSSVNFVVKAPTIYAIDYQPGAGNDWQWVRFRSRVVDQSGMTVQPVGAWSPWAPAYDNSPAAYSGNQTIGIVKDNPGTGYRVMIDVEWWSQTERLWAGYIPVSRYYAYAYFTSLGAWQTTGIEFSC